MTEINASVDMLEPVEDVGGAAQPLRRRDVDRRKRRGREGNERTPQAADRPRPIERAVKCHDESPPDRIEATRI